LTIIAEILRPKQRRRVSGNAGGWSKAAELIPAISMH